MQFSPMRQTLRAVLLLIKESICVFGNVLVHARLTASALVSCHEIF